MDAFCGFGDLLDALTQDAETAITDQIQDRRSFPGDPADFRCRKFLDAQHFKSGIGLRADSLLQQFQTGFQQELFILLHEREVDLIVIILNDLRPGKTFFPLMLPDDILRYRGEP